MKEIKLGRKVYTTSKNAVSVYAAVYDGEKCYAIVHGGTGFTTVFDYEKRVWESMKRIMREKGYTLHFDNDRPEFPRFRLYSDNGRIDLRQFLWARYNKRYLSSVDGKVYLRQDDRADNFCDLRHHNIYLGGDSLEGRDNITVSLISNPKEENNKYIEILFNTTVPFTEYVPYTPELWEMLNTPRYARLGTISLDRGTVEVDGYSSQNHLARFVCVYKKYFPLYQGKRDSVRKFIRDYQGLSEREKNNQAAHVSSCYHDNTFENLMFMDRAANRAMSDYIKWLADGYDAYTAVNDRDEILLEFITPLRDSPQYIKFEMPEDYADFQKVYIYGTKLSNKMQVMIYPTSEGLAYQMTPIGMKAAGIVNRDTVNAKELDFWTDREHKERLLSLPDEAFTVYHKETLAKWLNSFLDGVSLPDGMKKGDKVFFPIDGGGFGTVEFIRAARQKRAKVNEASVNMADEAGES